MGCVKTSKRNRLKHETVNNLLLVKCETAKRSAKKRKGPRNLDVHSSTQTKSGKCEAREIGGEIGGESGGEESGEESGDESGEESGSDCVPVDVPNYARPYPPFDIARVAYLWATNAGVQRKMKVPKVRLSYDI